MALFWLDPVPEPDPDDLIGSGSATLVHAHLLLSVCRSVKIREESLSDVVPLYRAEIWAALLHIDYDVADKYARIDKETWNPVDRQIEVDIPRLEGTFLFTPQFFPGPWIRIRMMEGLMGSDP